MWEKWTVRSVAARRMWYNEPCRKRRNGRERNAACKGRFWGPAVLQHQELEKKTLKAFVSSTILGYDLTWYFLVACSVGLLPPVFPIMRFKSTPFTLYAPSSIKMLWCSPRYTHPSPIITRFSITSPLPSPYFSILAQTLPNNLPTPLPKLLRIPIPLLSP